MWHLLAAVTRNLHNTRKSSKVADENMFQQGNTVEMFGHERGRRQHGWGLVLSILQAPMSMLSCVSHPQVNGPDGVWVTGGEFSQISEMNYLMVSDSMRYAILM
ncbi:uncharacterized protein LOC130731568 [Lotus japonicus]|uniref:uncharacterized protein LOC130731568 n=1 Tax=Lotus japonicus TaxID=34305 RepID=UPI0025889C07|nr:uncharacterized protein LOC130731568 [Lotus japonicus]